MCKNRVAFGELEAARNEWIVKSTSRTNLLLIQELLAAVFIGLKAKMAR